MTALPRTNRHGDADLAAEVKALRAENERLTRNAHEDARGLNRWCDYQDRLFAVMSSDEIKAFDARLSEGNWMNQPLCRHEAERDRLWALLDPDNEEAVEIVRRALNEAPTSRRRLCARIALAALRDAATKTPDGE